MTLVAEQETKPVCRVCRRPEPCSAERILDLLPAQAQALLRAYYQYGMSQRDLAALLGVTRSNLRRQLARIRTVVHSPQVECLVQYWSWLSGPERQLACARWIGRASYRALADLGMATSASSARRAMKRIDARLAAEDAQAGEQT